MKHLGSKIAQMGMRIKTNGFIARYYPKGFIAVHLQWLLVADLKGVYQSRSRRQLTPVFDKPSFSRLYAPQTKILEDGATDRSCIFEALFKGVSTGFGLLLFEKCLEKLSKRFVRPSKCSFGEHRITQTLQPQFVVHKSAFQNLRLGNINFREFAKRQNCLKSITRYGVS